MLGIMIAFIIQTTPPPTPTIDYSAFQATPVSPTIDTSDELAEVQSITAGAGNTELMRTFFGYVLYAFVNPGEYFGFFDVLVYHIYALYTVSWVLFALYMTMNIVNMVLSVIIWLIRWLPFL